MDTGNSRVCVRCVMDTTDPDITFDADGRCNHCCDLLARLSRRESREASLGLVVDRIRRAARNSRYDCLVGLSGGVDSSYTAYLAKSLGLRPLALHVDNGWDTDIAVRNIKNVCSGLSIPYQSYVLDWEEFRDVQLAFFKASVPEIETPTDIAILSALHQVASAHGIGFIVSGGNDVTEGILPKQWHYDAKDFTYLKAIYKRFGRGRLKTFPTLSYRAEMYYKLIRRIRIVNPLNCVAYCKSEAKKLLENKFGWQDYGGKHHESRITRFVQSYVLPEKFDMDYRKVTLSSEICAGAITRAQALEVLGDKPYNEAVISGDKEYVAKKFRISTDELEATLRAPRKSHHDYPNQERWLQFVYRMYRRWDRYANPQWRM